MSPRVRYTTAVVVQDKVLSPCQDCDQLYASQALWLVVQRIVKESFGSVPNLTAGLRVRFIRPRIEFSCQILILLNKSHKTKTSRLTKPQTLYGLDVSFYQPGETMCFPLPAKTEIFYISNQRLVEKCKMLAGRFASSTQRHGVISSARES